MSNPNFVSSSANPSPIPSVAPVIMAQHYFDPVFVYLDKISFNGINYLNTYHEHKQINFTISTMK